MTMRLTKLEHACLMLERGAEKLIIDPGKFTTPITDCASVAAVVITHEHDDHWTKEQLGRILAKSPNALIFSTAAVLEAVSAIPAVDAARLRPAIPGETHPVGPFTLRFHGGTHAEIHRSIPRVDNVGVLVNEAFYTGGDAYDAPRDVAIDLLAVPVYGPWMRIADSIDYVLDVQPRAVVPVHEMLLARAGKELATQRLRAAAEEVGGRLLDLQPYDTADIRDAALAVEAKETSFMVAPPMPAQSAATGAPDR